MDKDRKKKIKEMLMKKREELIKQIKNIKEENLGKSQKDSSGDLSGYSFHMADVASDNFERELSLDLAANEVRLLHQIEDALRRIKEKDFGKCSSCGKNIAIKRLMAVPYAELCLPCQEQEDKQSG